MQHTSGELWVVTFLCPETEDRAPAGQDYATPVVKASAPGWRGSTGNPVVARFVSVRIAALNQLSVGIAPNSMLLAALATVETDGAPGWHDGVPDRADSDEGIGHRMPFGRRG